MAARKKASTRTGDLGQSQILRTYCLVEEVACPSCGEDSLEQKLEVTAAGESDYKRAGPDDILAVTHDSSRRCYECGWGAPRDEQWANTDSSAGRGETAQRLLTILLGPEGVESLIAEAASVVSGFYEEAVEKQVNKAIERSMESPKSKRELERRIVSALKKEMADYVKAR